MEASSSAANAPTLILPRFVARLQLRRLGVVVAAPARLEVIDISLLDVLDDLEDILHDPEAFVDVLPRSHSVVDLSQDSWVYFLVQSPVVHD